MLTSGPTLFELMSDEELKIMKERTKQNWEKFDVVFGKFYEPFTESEKVILNNIINDLWSSFNDLKNQLNNIKNNYNNLPLDNLVLIENFLLNISKIKNIEDLKIPCDKLKSSYSGLLKELVLNLNKKDYILMTPLVCNLIKGYTNLIDTANKLKGLDLRKFRKVMKLS